ncbi:DNA topoisomerase IB [soil metagenome]
MATSKPLFDVGKARQAIEKGRRAKWWKRRGSMKSGFHYVDAEGQKITDEAHLERIKGLVIPPAWKYIRISPTHGSRLQAVGMDTNGRVQYLYHAKFAARQQARKFSRIVDFGKHLPRLRQVTNEHIMLDGFPREKVLAVMTRLINSLYFRVGTEKSAKHYRTYGITTLQNKHLTFGDNGELIFDFVGKSHVKHRKILVDKELAEVMKVLKSLGGARKLFNYLNGDGKARPVRPSELNEYIKSSTSPDFSSKDFRTWAGSLLMAVRLGELGKPEDEQQIKKNIIEAVKCVAEDLGNTPTVCRSSYIHPAVLKCYEQGMTIDNFRPRRDRRIKRLEAEYEPEESALLKLLQASSLS